MSKLHYRWLLFLIFLAGASIRLFRIGDQVVIDDEWHALNAVQYHDFGWIFTHFGDSNHSILLSLLYELQYQLTGLNELLLRWPMLLAGCAVLLVFPYMLRHWLNRRERLVLAALLAISPFLIYYSRFARPYSILVLLESGALLMAWHWWNSQQLKHAIGWVLLATVSAWFSAPALIVVTAPFVWFGLLTAQKGVQTGNWAGLARLTAIGVVMLALLAVFLGPALTTQLDALTTKAGQHLIDLDTLPWALSLASGSGRVWVFAPMGLLSLLGLRLLFQRDKAFAGYLLVTGLSAVLVLIVTGAAFALHGNVFLRYLVGLLPFYLAYAAMGLVHASNQLIHRTGLPLAMGTASLVAAIVVLVVTGPVPDWPLKNNQFTAHQNYHFHYNPERNIYSEAMDSWYQAEPFYEEIAATHTEGEAVIVEAPWYLESYANPLNRQQEVHRQRVVIGFVNGVCAGPLFGELTAGQAGMRFRNFVYLQELLDGSRTADYLVLRRRGMPEFARVIEMDFDQCEQAVRTRFGEPWRETESALVFRITPSG